MQYTIDINENWTELIVGNIPRNASDQIVGGEEFDEIVSAAIGTHPDSHESLFPGTLILRDFNTDDFSSCSVCNEDGISTFDIDERNILIVYLDGDKEARGDEEEWASGHPQQRCECIITDKALETHLREKLKVDNGLIKELLLLFDEHNRKTNSLIQNCRSGMDDGEFNVFIYAAHQKGCRSFAEFETPDPLKKKDVLLVFFMTDNVIPFGDKFGIESPVFYLAAICANNQVLDIFNEDDRGIAIDRKLIRYSPELEDGVGQIYSE